MLLHIRKQEMTKTMLHYNCIIRIEKYLTETITNKNARPVHTTATKDKLAKRDKHLSIQTKRQAAKQTHIELENR